MTELALATQDTPPLSGAGLLGLVTTGMYNAPLSMYREYIQNAADAVAGSRLPLRARVDIVIDNSDRRIRIRDNGPGLSPEEAIERLLPIGRSAKTPGIDRGFRGVGRLAGLAFAKTVSFTTRARGNQAATRIVWHSNRLPELTSTESELEEAIRDCVNVESLPASDYPEHFFEVEIGDVSLHSAGLLLNRDAVRDYVGEVCPVPMSSEFRFADMVEGLFHGAEAPLTLDVVLEGDPNPIERPYGESIRISANKEAEFKEFQIVHIPSRERDGLAAVGWVAHSSYLGAIPKALRVRGIRARMGNIQIGGEAVFDDLFAEERFNRWCVGEIHILDPRIVPNSRRDYFEPGPHLRDLENSLTPVLRNISTRCRRESSARNRARKALSALCNIEDLCTLATSGYLTSKDSAGFVQEALQEIDEVRKRVDKDKLDNGTLARVENAEGKLKKYSVEAELQRFGDMPPWKADVYQGVFGALAKLEHPPRIAIEKIESVFALASGVEQTGSGINSDRRTGNHSRDSLWVNRGTSTKVVSHSVDIPMEGNSMAAKNGEFAMLPVETLVLDTSNPRVARYIEMYGGEVTDDQMSLALGAANYEQGESTTTFQSLRTSIRTHGGLIHPILVNRESENRLVVIEGNTRALIYRQFRSDGDSGRWDVIPALVYDQLDEKEIDSIRLQAHLVGPRQWDPYSKAKYLNYLSNSEHLTTDQIIDFCGGQRAEVHRFIDAYNDMEDYYRPLVASDDQFDPTRFSAFVEMQAPRVQEALVTSGYTKTDFAKWG